MDILIAFAQRVAIELALFAGSGFALFAVDEMLVDLLWMWRASWRHFVIFSARSPATAESIAAAGAGGRIAVFVPAWDEADVIGQMLSWAEDAYAGQSGDIFVGCYPNDSRTLAVLARLHFKMVRIVVLPNPGPSTKADCLNHLWLAMKEYEERLGIRYKGVVLHDAEDMVSSQELGIFNRLLDRFDMIQLPVIPSIDWRSRFVAGHYCDEFAEAHGKTLIVREMMGAAIPSAGVGCALGRDILTRLATRNDGRPFNIDSLTEDYEVGLHIKAMGGRTVFVRLSSMARGAVVGTRAHFPATVEAAVRQKARWMVGITLAGWDRLGWNGGLGETWMRWRDRSALLAALLILSGYAALTIFIALQIMAIFVPIAAIQTTPFFDRLLIFNAFALLWRCTLRAWFVGQMYGAGEAFLSIIRMPVANFIMVMAARRAIFSYLAMLKSGEVVWDKTTHHFPTSDEPAG